MITFYEPGVKRLFRKHAAQAAALQTQIAQMLAKQLETGFAKVKAASHVPFAGEKVWELRVNPAHVPPIRVAFTRQGDQFTVVYLTHTLQKSEFTRELEKFLKSA